MLIPYLGPEFVAAAIFGDRAPAPDLQTKSAMEDSTPVLHPQSVSNEKQEHAPFQWNVFWL